MYLLFKHSFCQKGNSTAEPLILNDIDQIIWLELLIRNKTAVSKTYYFTYCCTVRRKENKSGRLEVGVIKHWGGHEKNNPTSILLTHTEKRNGIIPEMALESMIKTAKLFNYKYL